MHRSSSRLVQKQIKSLKFLKYSTVGLKLIFWSQDRCHGQLRKQNKIEKKRLNKMFKMKRLGKTSDVSGNQVIEAREVLRAPA